MRSRKLGFHTKIVDLEGTIEVLLDITLKNGRLKWDVEALTKEEIVLTLIQEHR